MSPGLEVLAKLMSQSFPSAMRFRNVNPPVRRRTIMIPEKNKYRGGNQAGNDTYPKEVDHPQ